MARSFKGADAQYHHGNWHYLDLPIYLDTSDESTLNVQVDVNETWSSATPAMSAGRPSRPCAVVSWRRLTARLTSTWGAFERPLKPTRKHPSAS